MCKLHLATLQNGKDERTCHSGNSELVKDRGQFQGTAMNIFRTTTPWYNPFFHSLNTIGFVSLKTRMICLKKNQHKFREIKTKQKSTTIAVWSLQQRMASWGYFCLVSNDDYHPHTNQKLGRHAINFYSELFMLWKGQQDFPWNLKL